ncbi:hypothetical protein CC1G_02438 [Coprinopsis cinerea okayama7|uniref:Peptidase C14 caspase domain-containing protein n=1 Tax=Coprinopsis cinerea (strain Okayama-7 / 130 / ATCC MYA-4618 / FGSC 9003) TaxID=240176 RepID=A8NBH8_COPC7|nr:hypothetical protein CC1G_02438 [Coprinopsis cinerea okayama7\|eukprot:XP_001832176.1 hypothetical protein CC1G_02438 [Coprinopsis cinerea okayama7\
MASTGTRVFALLIAIDTYKSPELRNLRECVNDAILFRNYLIETFGPHNDKNIRLLRNAEATREAILSTFFSHLIDNRNIQPEDPVIFYFAGHGIRTMKPDGWPVDSKDMKIEAICPHDERCVDPRSNQAVWCIPDITIAKLLRQLEIRKRTNVTVILDSCHSGGGIRKKDENEEDYLPYRCRNVLPVDETPFPPHIDRKIWDLPDTIGHISKQSNDIEGLRKKYGTETLLAACDPKEKAKDGYFTRVLVEKLRSRRGVYTTLSDLDALVPSRSDQHPVCQGNPNKVLFSTTIIDSEKRKFLLKQLDNGKFEVNAGGIHGIARGTLFQLPNRGGVLMAESTQVFSSILVKTPQTSPNAVLTTGVPVYAIPSLKESIMAVWLDANLKNRLGARLPIPTNESWFTFLPDSAISKAHIHLTWREAVRSQPEKVIVNLLDPLFANTNAKSTAFAYRDVCSRFEQFLETIALFRYHLGRNKGCSKLFTECASPVDQKDPLCRSVDVAMYRVEEKDAGYVPVEPAVNLFKKGVATLKSSSNTQYGFRILNKSKTSDLYFYVFYFDPASFSIDLMSVPQAAKKSPGESITPGYASEPDPFDFALDEPDRAQSGFIKVFASTRPVERMESLEQKEAGRAQSTRKIGPREGGGKEDWGAWVGVIDVLPARGVGRGVGGEDVGTGEEVEEAEEADEADEDEMVGDEGEGEDIPDLKENSVDTIGDEEKLPQPVN